MDTNTIILYILTAISIFLSFWILRLEMRLKKFFRGKNARTLEDTLGTITKELERTTKENGQIQEYLKRVDTRLTRTIRNVETTRFNPFADAGSNQSFATALVNDEGDGVVISSLYSRERVSIFAKPISKGKSTYDLTEEEKQVLTKSLSS